MKISVSMYRALCYADVFHFPLTLEEMKKYAIVRGASVSQKTIDSRVVCVQQYYCLRGSESSVRVRRQNFHHVETKMRLAWQAARMFALMPTVLGVFVTGGLAVGNVKPEDDIDFMIVTKQGWLWTTRFVLVVISKLLGKYTHKRLRREDATAADANTWCLNMWLDETALAVPKAHQNLYTAHEVIQALPLVNREKIAERFLWANRWVGSEIKVEIEKCEQKISQRHDLYIENFFRNIQTKNKNGLVWKNKAIFHPKNTGIYVLIGYKNVL